MARQQEGNHYWCKCSSTSYTQVALMRMTKNQQQVAGNPRGRGCKSYRPIYPSKHRVAGTTPGTRIPRFIIFVTKTSLRNCTNCASESTLQLLTDAGPPRCSNEPVTAGPHDPFKCSWSPSNRHATLSRSGGSKTLSMQIPYGTAGVCGFQCQSSQDRGRRNLGTFLPEFVGSIPTGCSLFAFLDCGVTREGNEAACNPWQGYFVLL